MRAVAYWSLIGSGALAVGWIRGIAYLRELRMGQGSTPTALLDLGYLIVTLLLPVIILVRAIRRRRSLRNVSSASGELPASQDPGLAEKLRDLQVICRRAFARQPVLTSVQAVLVVAALAGIPIVLLALGRSGGVTTFGLSEWIILSLAELPLAFVVSVVLIGFVSHRDPRR